MSVGGNDDDDVMGWARGENSIFENGVDDDDGPDASSSTRFVAIVSVETRLSTRGVVVDVVVPSAAGLSWSSSLPPPL